MNKTIKLLACSKNEKFYKTTTGKIYSRHKLISFIKNNKATITTSSGAEVSIFSFEGKEFLRSDHNNKESDNLSETLLSFNISKQYSWWLIGVLSLGVIVSNIAYPLIILDHKKSHVTEYNVDGTNWSGYISGTLTCVPNWDGTYSIVGNSNYIANSLIIPRFVTVGQNQYPLTSIGTNAFRTSTITEINCNGVTSIGDHAFTHCLSLTKVNLGDVKTIGDYAFDQCTSLGTVNLNAVAMIGTSAFSLCPLNSITIDPANAKFNWVGTDQHNGFVQHKDDDDEQLTPVCDVYGGIACGNITISESIIGYGALGGCAGITSVSGNITTIEDYAFNQCAQLGEIDLTNVTTIGRSAFRNCNELVSVNLQKTTTISTNAFQECMNLREINLGADLTTLGDNVFSHCPLSTVTIDSNNTEFEWIGTDVNNGFIKTTDSDPTILTPAGNGHGGIACGNIVIPSTIVEISEFAFEFSYGITSIDLSSPDELTFGLDWNLGCENLASVTIGEDNAYDSSDDDGWYEVGPANCTLHAPTQDAANAFKTDVITPAYADKWTVVNS